MRYPDQRTRTTNDRDLFTAEEARLRRVEHMHAMAWLIAETWLMGTGAAVSQSRVDGTVSVVIGKWMTDDDNGSGETSAS